MLAHRATADVALVRLAAPLRNVEPARLARPLTVAPGDAFTVAGYGVAVRGDGKSGGTVRAASLVATGRPGNLQIRLVDPSTKGDKAGLGACTGDSGAPVFATNGAPGVIGVVSWSTGPRELGRLRGTNGRNAAVSLPRLDHTDRKTTDRLILTLDYTKVNRDSVRKGNTYNAIAHSL